jgi:putative ABC transport system substrate-binding protein
LRRWLSAEQHLPAGAQQGDRLYRVAYLGAQGRERYFKEALHELGWIEGKNVTFEYRYADNHLDRLSGMAAELVQLKVDVIVGDGTLASLAAKQATATIPIVMAPAGDPLGSGLVASLADQVRTSQV